MQDLQNYVLYSSACSTLPRVSPRSPREHAHVHAHTHGGVGALNPNAAWFAAMSVLAKGWLNCITKRVADEERRPVLLANAVHHRSNTFGSGVALVAILSNWS